MEYESPFAGVGVHGLFVVSWLAVFVLTVLDCTIPVTDVTLTT